MLALFCMQRSLLYRPMEAPIGARPLAHGAAQYWRFPAAHPFGADPSFSRVCAADRTGRRGAVAYFPGNSEQASAMDGLAATFPGCEVYALDYPSYEGAPGSPSEKTILASVDALLEKMADDGVDPRRMILIGRSLGSGPATHAAARGPCLIAALLTPYENLASVAFEHFPFAPTQWLMLDAFDASAKAPHAQCPAIVVSGKEDAFIPEWHAHALFKLWNPRMDSSWVSIHATHEDMGERPQAWAIVRVAAIKAESRRRG